MLAVVAALLPLLASATDPPGTCTRVTPVPVRWLLTGPGATGDKPPLPAPPVPEALSFRVAFWERVWGELESGQLLLVDERRPWVVHAEVDCRGLGDKACGAKKGDAKRAAREAMRKKSARDHLYGKHSKLARDAHEHLLFVEGRKDGLARVLERHASDVAAAEAMFDLVRVPRAFARLAVVESMMRHDAVSSAGATGTYQLMPLIAQRYLMVREGVDERLDPVRSSLAAAKYLKRLKAELGSWPHALTAYNAGPTRLRAIMRQQRTRDVAKIVDAQGGKADHDGFGWASQNYYAKVMAVANVTRDREFERRAHGDIAVRVDKKMKVAELAACVGVDEAALVAANPSLTAEILAGRRPVPKGYLALVRRPPPQERLGG